MTRVMAWRCSGRDVCDRLRIQGTAQVSDAHLSRNPGRFFSSRTRQLTFRRAWDSPPRRSNLCLVCLDGSHHRVECWLASLNPYGAIFRSLAAGIDVVSFLGSLRSGIVMELQHVGPVE